MFDSHILLGLQYVLVRCTVACSAVLSWNEYSTVNTMHLFAMGLDNR